MGNNESSWKKYALVGIICTVVGWYYSPNITSVFGRVNDVVEKVKPVVEYLKPDFVKEKVDKKITDTYNRIRCKTESIDQKVQDM